MAAPQIGNIDVVGPLAIDNVGHLVVIRPPGDRDGSPCDRGDRHACSHGNDQRSEPSHTQVHLRMDDGPRPVMVASSQELTRTGHGSGEEER